MLRKANKEKTRKVSEKYMISIINKYKLKEFLESFEIDHNLINIKDISILKISSNYINSVVRFLKIESIPYEILYNNLQNRNNIYLKFTM
jgi:hypothetical protein